MMLAALRRPLTSFGRHRFILGVTVILALTLDGGAALGMGRGHGGGGFGGGHMAGGGFGGGRAGGSFGGGHVGGFTGSFGGRRFGGEHFAGRPFGGHFGGRQFGRFDGGRFSGGFHHFPHDRFGFRHGHGFHGAFVFGFPFYAYPPYPYYAAYSPYPYYAGGYCDPYSPWYNPAYCYWGYGAY